MRAGVAMLLRQPGLAPGQLTLSGNEITDVVRLAGLSGDGLQPEGSTGIWPAATNLCTNGGFETNTTGWTGGGTFYNNASTISRDTTQAKFGSASLKCVTDGLASVQGFEENATLTLTTGSPYIASFWVYAATSFALKATVGNSGAGEFTHLTFNTVAGQWTRFSIPFTPTNASNYFWIYVNGTAARTWWTDGVQVETGSVATPYINTDGGTASRSAGRVQAPASLLNATQSWVAMRVRAGAVTAANLGFFEWADNANNRLFLYASASTNVALYRVGGGAGGAQANKVISAWAVSDYITVIGKWTATSGAVSYNGSAFGTPSSPSVPTLSATSFNIGDLPVSLGAGSGSIKGDILWFACGTGTLSDADAAYMYALGNADPDPRQLPGQCTAVWDGRTGEFKINKAWAR